jgi:hypothetical protein
MGSDQIAWSWRDLQETPAYVQRFAWDLLNIKRRCIAERQERASRQGGSR